MSVFTFAAICVMAGLVGSMWTSWLRHQQGEPIDGVEAEQLKKLEKRVEALEERDAPATDVEERVRVLEEIVVQQDRDLASEIDALEEAATRQR